MKKKLSIIVPCYNSEKTIKRCVDSLIKCTYENKEIILINDGSKDNTKYIIDTYSKKYKYISSYSIENQGAGIAREYGIKKASGKYITFVDADDYIEPSGYELTINLMEKKEADVVYYGCNIIASNTVKQDVFNCYESYDNNIDFIKYMFSNGPKYCGISCWSGIYKLDIIRKIGRCFVSEREYLSEDTIFNYRYVKLCNKIVVSKKRIYNYVKDNNQSITNKYRERMLESALNLTKYLLANEENNELREKIFLNHIISINNCIQLLFKDDNYDYKNKISILKEFCKKNEQREYLKQINDNKLPYKYRILKYLIIYNLKYILSILVTINQKVKLKR